MKKYKATIITLTFVCLLGVFISLRVAASEVVNPLGTPQDCARIADSVVSLIYKGQSTNIYDFVQKYYIRTLNKEDMQKGFNKVQIAAVMLGNVTGYERISARQLGSTILVLRYVEKHETGCVLYTIRFYRPKEQWLMENIDMEVRADLDDLIKELDPSDWSPAKI
jgi:hypothetical protein